MVEFRYPISSLVRDYFLGILGLAASVNILVASEAGAGIYLFFAGLTAFFLIVTLNAANRHVTRVIVTDAGIASGPWPRRFIAWQDLTGLNLKFYATRSLFGRDKGGWLSLKLKSKETTITIDSQLQHFQAIVTRASHAARENGVLVDALTAHNLKSIGIEIAA
jgi:hypothetical protein